MFVELVCFFFLVSKSIFLMPSKTFIFIQARYSNSHTLIAVAAVQGADHHIRSSLGFSNLPKDTSTRGIEPATFHGLLVSQGS